MKKAKVSLKMSLMTTIVICWLVPIIIVVTVASVLLGNSYRQRFQQEIDGAARNALSQVELRLQDAIYGSKAVSYDGVIRSAYREYQQGGTGVQLYRTVQDYLAQSFSRDEKCQAVFISFWRDTFGQPYVLGGGAPGSQTTQIFWQHTDEILQVTKSLDTQIQFLFLDGEVYMARNLLDSSFTPYATVVMMLSPRQVFGALTELDTAGSIQVTLDDCHFQMDSQGVLSPVPDSREEGEEITFSTEVDGHTLSVTASTAPFDMWGENPWLFWGIAAVATLVLPLLLIIIFLFSLHVTRPIQTLAEANQRVQAGQRGYQIDKRPPNVEFQKLYANFNDMSRELESQFQRSYLEQQATQRAQIKALQSQINPHFLNNTLEIINWEARLADNERVSAMIEALSTMLDAALDRDGHTQIPLRQELIYVDAYLYIIQERLGDGFHVHKDIDEALLETPIPKLILQPIVENAVEHDITARRGGHLWVRVRREPGELILEVEHDGTMTDADRENIRTLLSEQATGVSQVGLRNVYQRLGLIYGSSAALQIEETASQTILARISIPMEA